MRLLNAAGAVAEMQAALRSRFAYHTAKKFEFMYSHLFIFLQQNRHTDQRNI
jgi:hypothetical protein